MLLVVTTVTTVITDPPADTVTVDVLRVAEGPVGLMVAAKLTVPVKLLILVIVSVDVAEEPGLMLKLLGLEVKTKSGVELVESVAVCTASGTEFGEPFAMSTHVVVPATLLEEQPVWNPIEVPLVVAVTL